MNPLQDTQEKQGGISPADGPAGSARKMSSVLVDRYRCSEEFDVFSAPKEFSHEAGYFRFGPEAICYGQCSSGKPAHFVTDALHDASQQVTMTGGSVFLPFDPAQVVHNLCWERYATKSAGVQPSILKRKSVRVLYYAVRPLLPVAVRKHMQKAYLGGWEKISFPKWPLDTGVDEIFERLLVLSMKAKEVSRLPFIWFWPDGAPSCTIITHDVETPAGVAFCPRLMDLNDSFAIKSSFQIIPEERYPVERAFLESIRSRGFEINVHDLNHDGYLFSNPNEFGQRAERINSYGRAFGAAGFRSAVLYRNPDMLAALDFSYDMSFPNVAHLDPQRGGCCTVMPYFIRNILELPVTTTQDYPLFNILNDFSTRLWQQQIGLIRRRHGLISFIVHPDYIVDEKARSVYAALLQYLAEMRERRETWIALPGQAAEWWRMRNEMRLVPRGSEWSIEGKGAERARIAYAVLSGDALTYEVPPNAYRSAAVC